MKGVLDESKGTLENQCHILHLLIDYVFFFVSEKIKKQHGEEAVVSVDTLNEHDWPAKVVDLVHEWLRKIINHSKFGGALLKKFGDEIHVSVILWQLRLYALHACTLFCRYGECYSQTKIRFAVVLKEFGSNGLQQLNSCWKKE